MTADNRQRTCEERIGENLESRVKHFAALVKASEAESVDDLTDDELSDATNEYTPDRSEYEGERGAENLREAAQTAIYELPLAVTTYKMVRVELSTGGPADWLEAQIDDDGDILRIEYVFQDWFDGARRTLDGSELRHRRVIHSELHHRMTTASNGERFAPGYTREAADYEQRTRPMTTETVQHTPGPWIEDGEEDPRELAADFGGIVIVTANGGDAATFTAVAVGSGPEAEANARLIAAAPDMLKALVMLTQLDTTPDGGVVIEPVGWAIAQDVLAKVRGL